MPREPVGHVDQADARTRALSDHHAGDFRYTRRQIFDCMEQSIRRSEKIEIRGFGTFQIRSYRACKGRNPRTGQIVEVKPKRLPHFKVSAELAARIDPRREKKLVETAAGDTSPSVGAGAAEVPIATP
ncbi:MAG: HU family DNA-binding protein [Polyangia bacterium]